MGIFASISHFKLLLTKGMCPNFFLISEVQKKKKNNKWT